MKHISIITGSDLRMVMGVNYFIKSFIQCNDYFQEVNINRVYSGVQSLKVDQGEQMPIGSDLGTTEYRIRRGFRTFLRKLLTDKIYPFALFKYKINESRVSRASVKSFFKDNAPCDCIVFQELGVAEYYFKHCHKNDKTRGIKTILVIHSEDDSGRMLLEKFDGWGYEDMKKRLYKMRDYVYHHIDKVVYISQKAYNCSILPLDKRAFVYNGSPIIPFNHINKEDNKTYFVCVGSIDGRKGQDLIVEALHMMDKSHLDRLHLTLVGGGSAEAELQKKVKEWQLSSYVTFTGRRNDVPQLLQTMDVFIMPSTVEGLPMSAIEAMRAGLFLILTDTGGNAELCDDGCGYVCTRSPENIVSMMYDTMDGKVYGNQQKEHSYARFKEKFSLDSMAKGYEQVVFSL